MLVWFSVKQKPYVAKNPTKTKLQQSQATFYHQRYKTSRQPERKFLLFQAFVSKLRVFLLEAVGFQKKKKPPLFVLLFFLLQKKKNNVESIPPPIKNQLKNVLLSSINSSIMRKKF